MRTGNFLLMGVLSLVIVMGAVGVGTPAASWATLQCGDHIGPNASAKLTHDLNCSGFDPALTVEGPARLLMQGHTIDCQDTDAVGIQVIGEAAIVQAGTVTGCRFGVWVGGQGGHFITKVTATQNFGGFLVAEESDGNTLKNNLAKDNSAGGFANRASSDDNMYIKNTALRNNGTGFGFRGNGHTLQENVAQDNGTNIFVPGGFQFFGEGLKVFFNRAIGNRNAGFLICCSGFQVLGNTAEKNVFGILLHEAAVNSTIFRNTALNNREFDLFNGNVNCDNNTWGGNRFRTSNRACIQ